MSAVTHIDSRRPHLSPSDRSRDEAIFVVVSVFASVGLIGYGILEALIGISPILNTIQTVFGLGIFANIIAFRYHGRLEQASLCMVLLLLSGFLLNFPHGGLSGTGIYWLFGMPTAVYLFLGVRRGLLLNVMVCLCVLVLGLLTLGGFINTYYDVMGYANAFLAVVAFTAVGHVTQLRQEKLRQEIARQHQRLSVILENIPAGVVVVDAPDGRIAAVNGGARGLLGSAIESVLSIDGLVESCGLMTADGSAYPTERLPLVVALKTGKITFCNDVFIELAGGERRALRVSGAPVLDANGKVAAAVAIFEDATKEYEVDQMKSEFVALASHQLKTPLTGIRWSAESLRETKPKLAGEQVEYVEAILVTVERLNRLVGDLLNVSHIETGRKFNLVQRPTDVAPLVREVVREQQSSAVARRIEITTAALPESLMLHVDGDKTKEVLMNLVSNAVKYSHNGGKVEIGTASLPDDGEVIFVKDDGIGIPKAQQDKIFSRFFRADNVPEDSEGTGLGMYIAKAIVEKQGGRLWFTSEENSGTIFYVQLPKEPAA